MNKNLLVLSSLFLLAGAAHAGKVEMFVDESYSKKIKREKLDCTIHKNKRRVLAFGFKLSVAFAAKAGPEVAFGRSAEINWGKMSQELIRRYEELCDFHNKGHLTVAEFNKRYDKLEQYFDKAKDLKEEIEDSVAARSAKQFKDLDAEAAKHSGADGAEARGEKLERIGKDLDTLAKEVSEFTAKKD